MTFDKFMDGLPELSRGITADDKAVLKQFLQHPSMLVVLAEVMFERSQLAADLLGADMKFYDNADKALYSVGKIQGEAMGLQKAIAKLFELSGLDNEEPEEANTPITEEEEEDQKYA